MEWDIRDTIFYLEIIFILLFKKTQYKNLR